MFFKKLKFLNIFLALLVSSTHVYASELVAVDYHPITRTNTFNPAFDCYPVPTDCDSPQFETELPVIIPHTLKEINNELNRMEEVQKALDIKKEVEVDKALHSVSKKIVASPAKIAPRPIQERNSPSVPAQSLSPTVPTPEFPEAAKAITIDEIFEANPAKPSIRIVYQTSIVIEGNNIEKFAVSDEGFINVFRIDRDHIKIEALKYGGTILNVWDEKGRRTIYVAVILPAPVNEWTQIHGDGQFNEHERPFRFSYANDYSSFYFAEKNRKFEKRSYTFVQSWGLDGQTPYGYFDTSFAHNNSNGRYSLPYYTLGFSRIPLEHTENLNLRFFDANRYTSPLTMPGTRLRGVFADVDIEDFIGIKYSHGERRSLFTFASQSQSNEKSYIDALKFTIFPQDKFNQISFNYAKGSGSDYGSVLTKSVYSVDASKQILNAYLNAELANAEGTKAGLAGIKLRFDPLISALNFRRINKDFTTISGAPSSQGETGVIWNTSYDQEDVSFQTVADVYREGLYPNERNPRYLNYDLSGRVRFPFLMDTWSDTSVYYIHTPGEISTRRNINLNERISKSVNLLGFKNTNLYVQGTMQRARYEQAVTSAYDRYTVTPGFQLPLTNEVSLYANYEYSWLHELDTNEDFNPNVANMGAFFNKQLSNTVATNVNVYYRNEMGVKGQSSFLAGEDSAGLSVGLTYNPSTDVNFFVDGGLRRVWPEFSDTLSYNDLDVRLGVRMTFEVFKKGWDPHGYVRGHVYKDRNNNGKFDDSDLGLRGVRVKVDDREVMTDNNGYYITDVRAKNAVVTPDPSTIPVGTVFSSGTSQTAAVKQWGSSTVDFGLNSQTGIYGLMFIDKNNNGIPDASDEFIKNSKIILDKKSTSTSDSQGSYYFKSITEGEHTLTIDINSLPIDMIPLITLENKIKVVEGTTYLFHIPLKRSEHPTEE